MIVHKCYKPGIHRGSFVQKCHINSIHQHKNAPDTCRRIVCRKIEDNNYIQGMFRSWFYHYKIKPLIMLDRVATISGVAVTEASS